ncbi:uncharacterized protein NPIL_279351 [Nephila pilipes]|uniref:Uncharacterized protein n=1 Tax=Nephila pilipes TaxID=299642 RepID=A0A8X6MWC1_NEPPI|nr:uncharacterized protein NPIL_279351 [Nephila pilipes]
MDKDTGESSGVMTRVKRFTVAIHPERRNDNDGDGRVVGSEILFANRLAPPLRENNKHIQETIQLSTADDSLKDLGKIEEESPGTKSVKYWAHKITYAFRSLTVSTKPRKNSFGSLFSSLGSAIRLKEKRQEGVIEGSLDIWVGAMALFEDVGSND